MDLLLDTTIQIDRITGSKERKKAIDKVLRKSKLFCSTYVLGEYYTNIVSDFVTLYELFLMDKDIGETGKRINEKVFGRKQSRVAKLYANIIAMCGNDEEEIEDTFLLYADLIQDEFYLGLEKEMIDLTGCPRGKTHIVFEDGIPLLEKVTCSKDKEICCVCNLWKQSTSEVEKIITSSTIDNRIIDILNSAKVDERAYRGNNCKTLGDTVISLEACKSERTLAVCTSNKKDFQPICDAIGIKLVTPDYSWKNKQKAPEIEN